MKRFIALFSFLSVAACSCHAVECESLKLEIERKIKASAVTNFTLQLAEATANAPGKLVGSCENGSKRIYYVKGTTNDASSKQAVPSSKDRGASGKPRASAVLTECKAGFSGPDCQIRQKAQ